VETTLNIPIRSGTNPKILAYEALYRPFDLSRVPLGPSDTLVYILERPLLNIKDVGQHGVKDIMSAQQWDISEIMSPR
jgi:hypothetical protein